MAKDTGNIFVAIQRYNFADTDGRAIQIVSLWPDGLCQNGYGTRNTQANILYIALMLPDDPGRESITYNTCIRIHCVYDTYIIVRHSISHIIWI